MFAMGVFCLTASICALADNWQMATFAQLWAVILLLHNIHNLLEEKK